MGNLISRHTVSASVEEWKPLSEWRNYSITYSMLNWLMNIRSTIPFTVRLWLRRDKNPGASLLPTFANQIIYLSTPLCLCLKAGVKQSTSVAEVIKWDNAWIGSCECKEI